MAYSKNGGFPIDDQTWDATLDAWQDGDDLFPPALARQHRLQEESIVVREKFCLGSLGRGDPRIGAT